MCKCKAVGVGFCPGHCITNTCLASGYAVAAGPRKLHFFIEKSCDRAGSCYQAGQDIGHSRWLLEVEIMLLEVEIMLLEAYVKNKYVLNEHIFIK